MRMSLNRFRQRGVSLAVTLAIALVVAAATAGIAALLVNINERKTEAKTTSVRLVEVTEDTTDPAVWGVNWPKQYDSYQRTAIATRTRFGGHGGSEALPDQKIERDPWLKRMFQGYAFSIDYRDRRGHAYMLTDQEETQRLTKPQSGSCLHCHASVMPLYRKLGNGDAKAGLDATHKLTYQETHAQLKEIGGAHPVSCVDCHDPKIDEVAGHAPGLHRGHPEARRFGCAGAALAVRPAVARRQSRAAVRPERGRQPQ